MFIGDIKLNTENPKDESKNLSEQRNEFTKVAGYKLCFYTIAANYQK